MSRRHPGPSQPYQKRNMPRGMWAATGKRHGGDDQYDEIAVERLLRGECAFLHYPADRAEALDRADYDGKTAREVAKRLRCTMKTVERRRKQRRERGIPRRTVAV